MALIKQGDDIGVPDFLHCAVCLEYFNNRSPRILNCHHSFCESCLKRLLKDSVISCPTCRTTTTVEKNDINNLPINFLLLQVLEREIQLGSRAVDLSKCYFCNERSPIGKCETCARVICEECAKKHVTSQVFHDHDIRSLCEPHSEGISHICFFCMKEICVKCAMFNHGDHEKEIIPYTEGMTRSRSKLEILIKDVEKVQTLESVNKSYDLEKMSVTENYKTKLEGNRVTELSNDFEKIVKIISEDEKQRNEVLNNYVKRETVLAELLENCKQLRPEKISFIAKFDDLDKRLQEIINEKTFRYIIPSFIPDKELTELVGSIMKITPKWLDEPILVQHLIRSSSLPLYVPIKASPVDDDYIVFADYHLDYISMVNREGELKGKYPTTSAFGRVLGLSICEGFMFVAQENGITKLILDHNNPKIVGQYQPEINFIRRLLAVSQTEIYCSDSDVGKVYKYNPIDDKTKTILKNINGPSYINFSDTDKGPRFFVTVEQSHQINIYTPKWELLLTVGRYGTENGSLRSPREVIVLSGSVLVADDENHRVCQFDQDGVFIRNVITYDHCGANPCGMVYQPPYLWITRRYSQGIMCFKILQ